MTTRLAHLFGWIALAVTITLPLNSPLYPSHGMDFFYYHSLARLSARVPGPDFYHARSQLIAVEAGSLGERIQAEDGRHVDDTTLARIIPRLDDPRMNNQGLPDKYFPEWSSLREITTNEFSKTSPATFGLLRLLQLHLLPWRLAFHIWNLLSIAVLLGACAVIRRAASLERFPYPWFATIAFWFNPCRSSLIYGQFMELALLGTALAILWLDPRRSRAIPAGIALGASLALKPLALGVAVFLAWQALFIPARRRDALHSLAAAAATALVLFASCDLFLGRGITREWFVTLTAWYGSYDYTIVSLANRSAMAAFSGWFGIQPGSPTLDLSHTIYVILTLSMYAAFFLGPRRREQSSLAGAAAGLMGFFFVSKFVLFQYEVLLLIPFAAAVSRALAMPPDRHRNTRLVLIAILWFGIGSYDSFWILLKARPECLLNPILLILLAV